MSVLLPQLGPTCSSGDEEKMTSSSPLITYQDHFTVDLCPPFDLAVDGKTFATLRESKPQEFQRVSRTLPCVHHMMSCDGVSSVQLLVKGTVFARMSPDQKAQLVNDLQAIG